MLATRRLLLLAMLLYAIIPLPWILWRPEALFYSFDPGKLPVIGLATALFLAGWMLGETARPRGAWFEPDNMESARQHWPAANAAIVAALLCSLAANVALYAMGALTIDEATGRQRVPGLTALGSAHIFALIYSGCLLFSVDAGSRSRTTVVLAVASVMATVGVGLVEGRRTAVVLPVVVYIALALVTGRRRVLRILLWTTPIFFALVALTTYSRTTVGDDVDIPDSALLIGGDALVGRLGNPLLILDPILENIQVERKPFQPHTLRSALAALPTFGLVPPPFETGFGNELGRDLGLLPEDNDFTGINSGWIGELLLSGGFPAVLLGGAALGLLAATAWQLIAAEHPAGLFLRVMVVIFVLSGFQMEVAFPIASLVRATAIALTLALLERGVAAAFKEPCSSSA